MTYLYFYFLEIDDIDGSECNGIQHKFCGLFQGLNFIAGLLLLIVKDEHKVFWLMDTIVNKLVPGRHNANVVFFIFCLFQHIQSLIRFHCMVLQPSGHFVGMTYHNGKLWSHTIEKCRIVIRTLIFKKCRSKFINIHGKYITMHFNKY